MTLELVGYSTTAASNNSASPNGWPEGMAPSGVNDSARENMAGIARNVRDTQGYTTSGGSSNAYTIALNATTTAAAAGETVVFKANHTNTGASTVNITPSGGSARGAVAIQKNGAALAAGEIVSGSFVTIRYDGTQYQLESPHAFARANTWTGVQTFSNGIAFANETLTTYDEGTFTPGIAFGGGTTGITYSNQTGTYTRIGNAVVFKISIGLSNKGSSTGSATVTGLPFTAANNDTNGSPNAVSYGSINLDTAGGYYRVQALTVANATTLSLQENGDNVGPAVLDNSDFGNSSSIRISGVIFV